MKNKIYLLILALMIIQSCKSDINNEALDKQKTIEIISQLLLDENLNRTNCILEKPIWKLKESPSDFESYIKENLNIKDTAFINFQIKLTHKFVFTKELNPDKEIITKDDFNNFSKTFEMDNFKYLDWLKEHHCEYGFISISKPIFNETYNLAIVHIEQICGPLCGFKNTRIYEFKDLKWMKNTSLNQSIY
ncbi:hypothetical protein [Mangrovimonas sp. DI 80]|uniref:hypothetical protein n=1 Tax=Mangrovimonas sp. DI 80 TaxID=1779330 RepID=UPI0009758981|nr:hypothetical protein [Mangrovimonas sp. DI 80]OMP32258.1 hypothetical protein BKM32_04185 [Mangrovimonas sp. DI 80]